MKKRIIPTILYDGTTVVKGKRFQNDRTVGNIEATANLFARRSTDEIILLDISATIQGKEPNFEIISWFSEKFDTPFAVGGGIKTVEQAKKIIAIGAEKIVVGASAFLNVNFISELAETLGSQAIVASADYDSRDKKLYTHSGKNRTETNINDCVVELERAGAGEILLQDINRDGSLGGLDLETISIISQIVSVPVIASCGAGKPDHFVDAFTNGASGVAAGAIFQFTKFTPREIAVYARNQGVDVRL
jgi:imidazole glycerol-phosphate synthase subunit HisF